MLNEGFGISSERISIPGTENISDLIELAIEGSEFERLKEATIKFFELKNISYSQEQFNSTGDLHSRFNLNDINFFDKAS